jgi:phosphoglycolate phosphatase
VLPALEPFRDRRVAVVFDLDGTLVDTAPDLTAALNHTLGTLALPPVPAETVRHLVGHGARRLIERGLELHGVPDAATVEASLATFLDHYAANICVASRPYPGVAPLLGALKEAGVPMAVCTNKPARMSRALLDALCLSAFFRANLGGDSLAVRKPDPRHLTETITRMGADGHAVVMVGDSSVDVATAKAAGVPVVAVSFGFNDRPVAELGADAIIDHFAEAPAALARLWSAHTG